MEIHFYTYEPKIDNVVHSWNAVYSYISSGVTEIHTTQMAVMSTQLILMGYKIFIHELDKEVYEIRLGSNTCTDKEIRVGHNLFKMWENNAFRTTSTFLNSAT